MGGAPQGAFSLSIRFACVRVTRLESKPRAGSLSEARARRGVLDAKRLRPRMDSAAASDGAHKIIVNNRAAFIRADWRDLVAQPRRSRSGQQ